MIFGEGTRVNKLAWSPFFLPTLGPHEFRKCQGLDTLSPIGLHAWIHVEEIRNRGLSLGGRESLEGERREASRERRREGERGGNTKE